MENTGKKKTKYEEEEIYMSFEKEMFVKDCYTLQIQFYI